MDKMPLLNVTPEVDTIGVDISKRSLDITGYRNGQTWHRVIGNDRDCIDRFLALIEGYGGLIICESTGWYHYLFARLCYERGLDIRVINPLLSSKHSKSAIRKVKSDPCDSRTLAIMGITEPDLPPRPVLSLDRITLRKKMGLLHAMDKQLQSLKQRLNDYVACAQTLSVTLDNSEEMLICEVTRLERIKRCLEREVEALAVALANKERSSNHTVVNSVPGFSAPVSGLVAALLDPAVPSAKSWIGFTGLDVSVRSSGRWVGKGRLTKRGNAYLRKRLYQAAWGACMNYPEFRQYYDQLKNRGRTHTEAVVIVARRLLRIAFTLIQKGETYSAEKAFACQKI